MSDVTESRLDLGALLQAVEDAAPVDTLEALAAEVGQMVDATEVSFLITDFSGDQLIRFVRTGPDSTGTTSETFERVPLHGTQYEAALRTQSVCIDYESSGGTRLYAPVTNRGDAIGVLELLLPATPDNEVVRYVASAAHALGHVVIANRRHTDLFEQGQRDVPFTLAAEIQRRLLPAAFTCEAAQFTVSGWLEPASDIGGDTFDYSVDRDVLHVSVTDAMGHTVVAAQLATLLVASLRNSRRRNVPLVGQAADANDALSHYASEEEFGTGILLRVDLASGEVSAINAGHPLPYLLRGEKVEPVELAPDLPFGMMESAEYHEQRFQLEAGDRLLVLTDGLLERNATKIDIETAIRQTAGLHPREVCHAFGRFVMAATGRELKDDATVLCLDWHGVDHVRSSSAGAGRRE